MLLGKEYSILPICQSPPSKLTYSFHVMPIKIPTLQNYLEYLWNLKFTGPFSEPRIKSLGFKSRNLFNKAPEMKCKDPGISPAGY